MSEKSRRLQGIGVYGGTACGIVRMAKDRVQGEGACVTGGRTLCEAEQRDHFLAVCGRVAKQQRRFAAEAEERFGRVQALLFEGYAVMAEDPELTGSVERRLAAGESAEVAVRETIAEYAEQMEASEDAYLRARAEDVRYVGRCLLSELAGSDVAQGAPLCSEMELAGSDIVQGATILCAEELTAEMILKLEDTVVGLVARRGSADSHSAVLAAMRGIPAVFGLGEDYEALTDGQSIFLNGATGEIVTEWTGANEIPEGAETVESTSEQSDSNHTENNAEADVVSIYANISSATQVPDVLSSDCAGIGLYRSEFLFLSAEHWPTEEEQYEEYSQVLRQMGGRPVVIRTLDIGGDKKPSYAHLPQEENPALGVRGIRFCLAHPELFRTQLRALYRASVCGDLRILFPMITSARDMQQVQELCASVCRELEEEGTAFSTQVKLGAMLETPSAVLLCDQIAPHADFFSIGTNDLTQYTLACDRGNEALADVREAGEEAVWVLLERIYAIGRECGISVCICGEMAAKESCIPRLLALGASELSVATRNVVKVRRRISEIRIKMGN